MSANDPNLQIEVTIDPGKDRRVGPRRPALTPAAADPPRVPRITRLMSLAIKFQDMVDRGEVRDYADLARLGLVTRARLTQVMNLLLLAPKIQETLLLGEPPHALPTERDLRECVQLPFWEAQQIRFLEITRSPLHRK